MNKKNTKVLIDLAIIGALAIITYVAAGTYDILEKIVEFSRQYESYEIDEIITVFIVVVFCLCVFSYRQWQEAIQTQRSIAQRNRKLKEAQAEIKQLKGIIPICSCCKNLRNSAGYWQIAEGRSRKCDFCLFLLPERALYRRRGSAPSHLLHPKENWQYRC